MNVLKPYFLYRPDLLLRRILHSKPPSGNGECNVTLPWGTPIHINSREMIGNSIWRTGVFELGVSEAICRLCQPGDTVADVGANIGYMTSIMAWQVGARGNVISFEPHPEVRKTLKMNIELFETIKDTGSITLHEVALSSVNGTAELITNAVFESNEGTASLEAANQHTDSANTVSVGTRRLDDAIGETKLRVMKVDVEGHELGVFQGATSALNHHRIDNIVYEEHDGPDSASHKFLKNAGYTIFSLGWQLNGPLLGDFRNTLHNEYETANFIATTQPETVKKLFLPRGWQVLKVRS